MFSFNNFYKPAPARAQRIAAACKAFGGAVGTTPAFLVILQGTEMEKSTLKLVACVMLFGWLTAAIAESMEKLAAAPAPAAAPDPSTDPGMHPEDVTTPPAGPTS